MQNALEVLQALVNGYTLKNVGSNMPNNEHKIFIDNNHNLVIQRPFGLPDQTTLYNLKPECWEIDDSYPVREFFN